MKRSKLCAVVLVFGWLYIFQSIITLVFTFLSLAQQKFILFALGFFNGMLLLVCGIGLVRLLGWARILIIAANVYFFAALCWIMFIVYRVNMNTANTIGFIVASLFYFIPIAFFLYPGTAREFDRKQ